MITPMTADGAVDYDGAARLATYLVDEMRNDGLVISGTTGESPTTTDAEKDRLLRAVIEAVGDRASIVAGVGTNDTAHTCELARQAERAGAAGLLLVTPYYNKPPQSGLVAHFTKAADSAGLPVMLYDIPGRTGTPIKTESLLQLAEHPRIVAVKDAKGDLFAGSQVMLATDLAFYSGDDLLNLPWLSVGAAGFVSVAGHVIGDRLHDMIDAYLAGRVARGPSDPPGPAARGGGHHDPHPGRDRGQGRARPARAARRGSPRAAHRRDTSRAGAVAHRPGGGGREAQVSHPHPELGTPPPLPDTALRIVGLGGLGEIGRNMTVFEYQGRLLIVDCGVLFPEPDQPGVDLILPDFTSLEGRLGQIEAMVLTHAHEDHIGAVPYLLRERADIPLVGSRLTLGWCAASSPSTGSPRPRWRWPRAAGCRSGPSSSSSSRSTTRSRTRWRWPSPPRPGVVLHTGDFKMDQLPLDGRLTDLGGFARIGSAGVDLLMSDSTNAEVPGIVTSEREISPVLNEIFGSTQQRIIVACFASHVHRVQQVLDAAAAHGRKVAFVGRSMVRNMGVARDLGYLRVPSVRGGLLVDPRDAESMPPGEVVLVCTGSQGEPMSALSRMAGRDHPIRIAEGDTVILASSLIPGNESAVYRVINELTRWGARVVHKGNALVHVSGHAPAGELLYVLNLVKPRNFMPVHGEWRHLRAHARLAELTGIPHRNVVIAEDGVVVDLLDGKASVVGKVPCGYVYVDGLSVGEVTETSLKDRRILGEEGFLSVVIVVDSTTGKLAASPAIHARGSGIDDSSLMEVRPKIEEVLARAAEDGINDAHQLGQLVRRTVGRWVNDTYRRRPMIIPVVIEV